jgi:hypothetical protein
MPFATMCRIVEVGWMRRNAWLESNGMTVPKPERKPIPDRVPATECCDARCNERGRELEVTA